jgi:hypothetical protein
VVRKEQNRQKRSKWQDPKKSTGREQYNFPNTQQSTCLDQTQSLEVDHDHLDEGALVLSNWTPSLPIEDIATAYFIDTYIRDSHFDYIPIVYGASSLGSPLSSAVNANACANLHRETGDPALLKRAQRHYVQALTQTSSIINSPDQAALDSTIASVLLLGLYEALTQGYRKCPDSFIAHNHGAAALLKLRGESQFSTPIGKRIFAQVSLNMRLNCTDRNVELPADFLEIDKLASAYYGKDEFLPQFLPILDEFNHLRVVVFNEIQTRHMTKATADAALLLDQLLSSVMEGFPDRFKFEIIELNHPIEGILGRSYHKYADHRIAQRWNAVRMMRLVLNELIWEHMNLMAAGSNTEGTSSTTSFLLQEIASRNVESLARQICASVPQFCRPCPNGLLPVTPTLFLLWPLTYAGHSRLSPPDVRVYAIYTLRFLGRETRLPQATWAADMIEENKEMEDWLHLSHLA